MTERDKFTSLATVLGIIIGVLGTCLVYSIVQKNSRLDGNYSQWRKLNLILEQVEKNYVDEVDVKKVTDAAVEASLAALDPHSVYLPPVELEESETELAGNFDGIGGNWLGHSQLQSGHWDKKLALDLGVTYNFSWKKHTMA